MKPIVYTDIINKNEKHAIVKGCKYKVRGLNEAVDSWFTLYYKSEEMAQKERSRMMKIGGWKHVSEVIPL
jgi:hypothetical protein